MTHAHFLRILEAEHHGLAALYIVPIWADIESLEQVPPMDAPHPGLTSTAFRFVYDLIGQLEVRIGSTTPFVGLPEIGHQSQRLAETHGVLSRLDKDASYGQQCGAWATAFGMAGVIVERSPQDHRCMSLRVSRRVQATVDSFLREWLERQSILMPPVIAGVASEVRIAGR